MTWEQLIKKVKDFDGIQIIDGYIQYDGLVFCDDMFIACQVAPYGRLEPLTKAHSIYHMEQIILAFVGK